MEFVKTLLEEQKELLTEELRFAEDLEYAETKQRLNEVTDALNKLFICDVSQQRELLKFFSTQLSENLDIDVGMNYITEEDIEECLKNFNCG